MNKTTNFLSQGLREMSVLLLVLVIIIPLYTTG